MRALLVALAVIVGTLVPAFPASTASAAPASVPDDGIGVRLVDVPKAAVQDPRARAYIVDHVKPGTAFERRIEVVNNGREQTRVAIYAAAADVTQAGFVPAAGRTQNELSSWVQATPGTLDLAAGQRSYVTVRIQVPPTAVRAEDYGVVWAETATPPQKKGGVTQIGRAGIRLYLSVGPGGAPRTDFTIESLTAVRDAKNVPMVRASVRNTGERALDLAGTLTLSEGPAGLSAGPFPVPLGTTLGIGETAPVLVPLDARLPDGPWLVKITMTSGTTERSAHASLTFPNGPGTGSTVSTDHVLLPWWAYAAVAVLLLATIALLVWRRRSRQERRSRA